MRYSTAFLVILSASCVFLENTDTKNTNKRRIINRHSGNVTVGVVDEVLPECTYGTETVSMTLYTRDITSGKNINADDVCGNIDPSNRIIFLVHGFVSFANYTNSYKLIPTLLENDFKVFSLDWSNEKCTTGVPSMPLHKQLGVLKTTRKIGHFMAKYVLRLIKECNVPIENIAFVGHSLGAHIAGFAAKSVQKQGIVPVLIATNPIKAFFAGKQCDKRLCKTDAKNVIIFHTSILGIIHNIGDVDFYFKGGHKQPGCRDMECSHSMGIIYLNEILKYPNCVFYGYPIMAFRTLVANDQPNKCVILNNTIFDTQEFEDEMYSMFVGTGETEHCFENVTNC